MYEELKQKYGISSFELIKQLEDEVVIPVSIFNKDLGALETICKYLKENLGFSNKKIGLLVGRDSKGVWQAYNKAKVKFPEGFVVLDSKHFIPVSILKNQKLSVLENIVSFLKDEFELSYHEIAILLKRDDRTIWTVYQKAKEKNVSK